MPDFELEDSIGKLCVGIDEAGRGPWPVRLPQAQ